MSPAALCIANEDAAAVRASIHGTHLFLVLQQTHKCTALKGRVKSKWLVCQGICRKHEFSVKMNKGVRTKPVCLKLHSVYRSSLSKWFLEEGRMDEIQLFLGLTYYFRLKVCKRAADGPRGRSLPHAWPSVTGPTTLSLDKLLQKSFSQNTGSTPRRFVSE